LRPPDPSDRGQALPALPDERELQAMYMVWRPAPTVAKPQPPPDYIIEAVPNERLSEFRDVVALDGALSPAQ